MFVVNIVVPIVYVLVLVLPIIFNRWTSKTFSLKWFNIVLGVFLLALFFGLRYIWYIFDYIQFTQYNEIPRNLLLTSGQMGSSNDNYRLMQSIIFSNIMLLNIGDLFSVLLPISMICFANKAFTKTIATLAVCILPWLDIFNYVTKIWSNINFGYLSNIEFWKYLFVSNGISRFPLIINLLTLFFASSIIVSTREYSRWSMLSTFIMLAIVISYINIMANTYGLIINTSGFSVFDWNDFTVNNKWIVYYGPFNLINSLSKDYLWMHIHILRLVNSLFFYMLTIIVFMMKNLFTSSVIKTNFIFNQWYENKRFGFLRSTFYIIDATINNFLWKFIRSNYLTASNKFNLRTQLKIMFSKKFKEQIICNNLTENNFAALAILRNISDSINRKITRNYKKIDEEVVHPNKHKSKLENQIKKQETQANDNLNKKREPYLVDGIWWYEDDLGNKYFSQNNEWVLFN